MAHAVHAIRLSPSGNWGNDRRSRATGTHACCGSCQVSPGRLVLQRSFVGCPACPDGLWLWLVLPERLDAH